MTPVDTIPAEQRASIIQNGLTHAECRLFFQLFDDAVRWRHEIVRSNRSGEQTEAEDRASWVKARNSNARLIAAVDALRDHFGSASKTTIPWDQRRCPPGFACVHERKCPGCV